MTDPLDRNRLDEEESPYLRQHADNPVNWQPWDETALEAARKKDRPIFLSIGYSACHWCHVMEEESFADDDVAELLNESFVPIKVDREERPDVDSVYMSVCQLVTGRGGWPLSAWLTPEGKPFHVGTYFPKTAKRGQPGFLDLLDGLTETWETDRPEVENRAEEWTEAVRGQLEETPGVPAGRDDSAPADLASVADTALRSADREHGGFGNSGPKFPQPARIHLLLRAHERTGKAGYADVARETLDAMADRGMYDHLGGGFHRYATDRKWTVPHFEKMLYDNAELPRLYVEGYRALGRERYAEVARETFAFLDRELSHPEGGFYSTLDARSRVPADRHGGDEPGEREEGAFWVWTPEEVRAAVEDELSAKLFCERYGVTERGNFEGANVLRISRSIDDLAGDHDLDDHEIEEHIERAREQAFDAREERPHPRRDEKVLAGWNGLTISALADGALALDPDYADRAARALSFVRDRLWDGETLHRRFKSGDVAIPGYLEDYAFLARGARDLYGVTGDVEQLRFALDLARAIEREFWDADEETIYFTPDSGDDLVARPQEPGDQSTPSSLGVAVELFQTLAPFAPDAGFDEIADAVLSTYESKIAASPMEHPTLALANDRAAEGPLELTIAAENATLPERWRDRLGSAYLPDRLLAPRPPTDEELDSWLATLDRSDAPPIWADRELRDGDATAYVCRSFTCSPPLSDPDAAIEWAADLAPE